MTTDLDRGAALCARARRAAAELGNVRARIMVESTDSYRSQATGDLPGAAVALREALVEFGEERWEGVYNLWGNLVWTLAVLGEHDAADEAITHALDQFKHPFLSLHMWEHLVENAAFTWMLTGQWLRARALLEESARWWLDDVRTSNLHLTLLDLMQRGAADMRRWRRHLVEPAHSGAARSAVRLALAVSASMDGDLTRMRADLAPLWTGERVVLDDDQLWQTALLAARAEADAAVSADCEVDRDGRAHLATLEDVTSQFRRYGRLGEVWPLDLAAQLDRFHGRDARPALQAALEGWERIGHVPDAAVTHLSLAEQEAVHGARDAARRHLAAGRAVAERLDAAPLLARADALAERWAIGPRERRTDGVLTEREVEVLRLVAEGMTNGQIGVQLFMAPKTASVHVSHILAKLGAANRTEAAATARRQGLLG
jgi:DNA-binding CsgD family transcriptional regulator